MPKNQRVAPSGARRRKRRSSEPVVDSIIHERTEVPKEKKICSGRTRGGSNDQHEVTQASAIRDDQRDNHPPPTETGESMSDVPPSSVNSFNNESRASCRRKFNLTACVDTIPDGPGVDDSESMGYVDKNPSVSAVHSLPSTAITPRSLHEGAGSASYETRKHTAPTPLSTTSALNSAQRLETYKTLYSQSPAVQNDADRQTVLRLSQQVDGLGKILFQRLEEIMREVAGVKSDVAVIKSSTKTIKEEIHEEDLPVTRARKGNDPCNEIEGFSALFNKHVNLLVFERCVLGMSMKVILNEDCGDSFLTRVGVSVQALMFSKLPRNGKAKFVSNTGVQYCALRRALVKTSLGTVLQDAFSRFETTTSDDTQTRDQLTWKGMPITSLGSKMKLPRWCSTDFVRTEHINEIQRRIEKLQASDTKGKTAECKHDVNREIALNVYACLFSKVTTGLTRARERCKCAFYEHVGFLFYNWERSGINLQQSETEFIWNVDTESQYSLDAIAEATELVIGKSDEEDVKASNLKVWNNLINKDPCFTLLASYNVSVRPRVKKGATNGSNFGRSATSDEDSSTRSYDNGDSEGTSEAKTRRIYRAFNLLDVAACFYSSYCNSKNNCQYDILYSSVHSLRVMFSFASILRKWMSELIDKFNERGPHAFSDEYENRGAKAGIYDLFPSSSRLQSALMSSCISLSSEEYADDCLDEKYLGRFNSFQTSIKYASSDLVGGEVEREDVGGPNESDEAEDCLLNGTTERFEEDDEEEDDFDFTQK